MEVPITPSKDVEVTGYTISFGDDGTLQFDPPQDSRKLAIALSIQFPMQRTLVDKLRAAQLSFLRSQGQNSADPETDPQQETTVALPTPKSAQLSNHGVIEKLRGIGNRQESMTLPQTKESEGEANKSYSDPSHSQKPKMKKRVRESPENASQPESNPKPMVHIWDSRTGETRQKRTRRTLEDAESVQVYENRGMVCDDHKASKTKCHPKICTGNKLFKNASLAFTTPQQSWNHGSDGGQNNSYSQLSGTSFENILIEGTANDCPKGCQETANYSHIPSVNLMQASESLSTVPAEGWDQHSFSLQNQNFHDLGSIDVDLIRVNEWEMGNQYISQPCHDARETGVFCSRCQPVDLLDGIKVISTEEEEDEADCPGTRGWRDGPGGDNGGGGPNDKGGNGGDGGGEGGAGASNSSSGSSASSGDPFCGWNGGGDYGWAYSTFAIVILTRLAWHTRIRTSLSQLMSWAVVTMSSFTSLSTLFEEGAVATRTGLSSGSGFGHRLPDDISDAAGCNVDNGIPRSVPNGNGEDSTTIASPAQDALPTPKFPSKTVPRMPKGGFSPSSSASVTTVRKAIITMLSNSNSNRYSKTRLEPDHNLPLRLPHTTNLSTKTLACCVCI